MKYLLLLLFCSSAFGTDIVIDGGIGVFNSAKKSLSETKSFSFGLQNDLKGPWKDRFVGGFWLDNFGHGRYDSTFGSAQIGYEVNNSGWIGGIFSGPAGITSPDCLLGGYFQFMTDIHLGIQDKRGYYFGIMYRHLSSAGLEQPNQGRDIAGVEMRF